jgi:hypothetical protein
VVQTKVQKIIGCIGSISRISYQFSLNIIANGTNNEINMENVSVDVDKDRTFGRADWPAL